MASYHVSGLGYKSMIPALNKGDYISEENFKHSELGGYFVIDQVSVYRNGKPNPDHLYELFGKLSGHTPPQVRMLTLQAVAADVGFYRTRSCVCLGMRSNHFEGWLRDIADPTKPCDELGLLTLCYLYRRHALVYTSTKLWSTVESTDPLSLLQLLNECSVKLVYLGDLEFGTLCPKGPPPMNTLPLPSCDEVSTSKLDVEQSSNVETTGDSANVETDDSESDTPEQASYVETHSSGEELSGHVETTLDLITVKQELTDVSMSMPSVDDEPPMLMPSEYVILKKLKVILTPLSEHDIQEWIKPTPLLENTGNKYSLRDQPSRSKVSGIILRNKKAVDYKPMLDSAIKSELPEFRRRKEKPRPCVSGPSSCRIRANALIRQAKRKQFQTKPVINKFPDEPSPPATNEGVTDDTTEKLPSCDRPVETASNHSELAHNVETDGSLTEDYDVPD